MQDNKTAVMDEVSTAAPQVEALPEGLVNNAPKLVPVGVGDGAVQGDIYFLCIAENGKLPKSCKPRAERQLASGSGTGARHVAERGEVFDADAAEVAEIILKMTKQTIPVEFIGPVYKSPADPTENDITHPEHGNQGFPAGCVMVTYHQRTTDNEEKFRPVID